MDLTFLFWCIREWSAGDLNDRSSLWAKSEAVLSLRQNASDEARKVSRQMSHIVKP